METFLQDATAYTHFIVDAHLNSHYEKATARLRQADIQLAQEEHIQFYTVDTAIAYISNSATIQKRLKELDWDTQHKIHVLERRLPDEPTRVKRLIGLSSKKRKHEAQRQLEISKAAILEEAERTKQHIQDKIEQDAKEVFEKHTFRVQELIKTRDRCRSRCTEMEIAIQEWRSETYKSEEDNNYAC